MRWVLLLLGGVLLLGCALLIGCYSPSPPSGAYRCSEADNACPSGQHCVCGLCVNQDGDAACGFSVDATARPGPFQEHESFPVTIKALQKSGVAAAGFNDTVSLAFVLPDGSSWCDVKPSTVQLKGGIASIDVILNRETIPPQRPKLRATFAGNHGDSAGIEVAAPAFTKDAMPIVPPAGLLKPFGWSDTVVAEPAMVHDSTGYRMYFIGVSMRRGGKTEIGLATSTDGRSFTPTALPVWTPVDGTWYSGSVQGPAPFFTQAGVSLAFTGAEVSLDLTPPGQIGVATSSDGMSFTVGGAQPVIHDQTPMHMADCSYCAGGIDFADVLDDPASPPGMKPVAKLMFFSGNSTTKQAVIGRASSTDDGKSWAPEPAPVLEGDIGGEAVLISPHVLVDGSVFKMWYSFVALKDVIMGIVDLCATPVQVGYATSSDGFYWVRSPSNVSAPAITKGVNGWDAGLTAFVAGAVLPSDGNDPSKGISLYYSTLQHAVPGDATSTCLPNGIGRSTRP